MYKKVLLSFLLMVSFRVMAQNEPMLFDANWRFHRGGAQGAEQPGYDDGKWRQLDLPHDWSIEDLPGSNSPFAPDAISQVSGGFTTGGTGWYRKTFTLPAAAKDQHVLLQFDGVYMNADVWVNGQHLGNHPYGYTSFYYDVTKQLKPNEKNVIAVQVKDEGANSRWYSGSGIYRHVWLKTVNPVHVAPWGVFISTPEISTRAATVQIKTNVVNESDQPASINVLTKLLSPAGKEVGRTSSNITLAAQGSQELTEQSMVKQPQLWSLETPALYKAVTEVYQDGKLLNSETSTFGIRQVTFDAQSGFQLNGKTVKLKGGCFHHDNGPLGAKAYDRAEERKVELLKASGYNALRCSHNPPSPAFLEACDRLGILVIDEFADMWNVGKNPYDYHLYFQDWWKRDVASMVTRDRNHPSIILWSIGNEIPERATPAGVKTALMLRDYVKELDPTRAVTAAVNDLREDKDPFFKVLDVAGYNYANGGDHMKRNIYELDHQRVPERIMVGTESYPLEAFSAWTDVVDHPYVIGDFVWTAFDYIGEASIGWLGYPQSSNFYPWNLAFCGDIDVCGWKRPQSYYRNALWMPDQLSVFVKPPQPSFEENPEIASWSKWNWYDVVPEWNWSGQENKPLEVNVYSSCDAVELFLNKKSLGKKSTNRSTKYLATWAVPYQAGELKAVGYKGRKKVKTAALYTAGKPAKMNLAADRTHLKANGQDLSYITVELQDDNGHTDPNATNLVHFDVTGDATIVGVGNANPMSLESHQLPKRNAWKGRCLVIVKAGSKPGAITLKATSEGLPASQVQLVAE
ncbi:glycoside hydrolase family 2 TIM barrel-domain containing protein [Pontibacter chitinilyticus]|uniref:glycoside hydrolase family 2 TIM barrel-domain containing protein n=1 Tax=Pontibacter chitinilyticus TaxID=2674989 RepID=UPI00321B66E5